MRTIKNIAIVDSWLEGSPVMRQKIIIYSWLLNQIKGIVR